LYVCEAKGNSSVIALASSPDFMDWKLEEPALVSDVSSDFGALESPFVLYHHDAYYLLVNFSHRQYEETLVFSSENPHKFNWEKPICTLFGHASEIFIWNNDMYISHCGIEDKHWQDINAPFGLYLARLQWCNE
jgi:hypothetical protein